MLLNCGAEEASWESLGLQGDQTSQSWKKSNLNIHWRDWCWRWSSNFCTWCKELTHWKRSESWERLRAEEEGDQGWDKHHQLNGHEFEQARGDSGRTGGPGVLLSTGSQRVGHNLATQQQQHFGVYINIFFIHSSTKGYLWWFHILAAINNAAVNIRVWKSLSFPSDINTYPEVKWLDNVVVLFFNFLKNLYNILNLAESGDNNNIQKCSLRLLILWQMTW